jgi:hypothetical protein
VVRVVCPSVKRLCYRTNSCWLSVVVCSMQQVTYCSAQHVFSAEEIQAFNSLLVNVTLHDLLPFPFEFNFTRKELSFFLGTLVPKQLCMSACTPIHSVI